MYEFPPFVARIAILICLYVFLFVAYRELYRTVRETRPTPDEVGHAPEEPHVLPTLVILRSEGDPSRQGETIPLLTTNSIGRSSDNQIVLADPSVSKVHARIDFDQGRFVLADMGSTNGTFLNGAPVTKPTVLRPGDRLQVGGSVLEFRAS